MLSLSYLFEGILTGFEYDYEPTTDTPTKPFSSKKLVSKLEKDIRAKELARERLIK